MVDVPDVELDLLGPGERRAALDLRPPGEPRKHLEPAALVVGVPVDLVAERRSRPDHGHLAAHDVPELGELVDGGAAEHPADAGDPRVAPVDRVARSDVLCAHRHRAELQELEVLAVLADPRLPVEHRAAVLELDRERRGEEERAREHEPRAGERDVGRAVHRVAAGSQAAGTPRRR